MYIIKRYADTTVQIELKIMGVFIYYKRVAQCKNYLKVKSKSITSVVLKYQMENLLLHKFEHILLTLTKFR